MSYSRDEIAEPPLRWGGGKYRLLSIAGVALAAILFQFYVPRIIKVLDYLELPLLVTLYFPLIRRSPLSGLFIGAGIGLAQDALSELPFGMFGIAKTLIGYLAGSISQRFDETNDGFRLVLAFCVFLFHQVLFWAMQRALRGEMIDLNWERTLVQAVLNALVAVPFFAFLDRVGLGHSVAR